MPRVLITEQYLSDIADSIRETAKTDKEYSPEEMSEAIKNIPFANIEPKPDDITENGEYLALNDDLGGYASVNVNVQPKVESTVITRNNVIVTPDEGVDGFSEVAVSIPMELIGDNITENGQYIYTPSENMDGISNCTINVDVQPKVEELNITQNGEYDATISGLDGYSKVTVDVAGSSAVLGQKTISSNGVYNATDDSFDGYSSVNVNVEYTSGQKTITNNGEYSATDDNLDGYSSVNVNVQPRVTELSVTENGEYIVDTANFDGYNKVNVSVPVSRLKTQSFSSNGTYNALDYDCDGFSSIVIDTPTSRLGTFTATDNGIYSPADYNLDGFSSFEVNVEKGIIPTGTYNITTNGVYNISNYENVNVQVQGTSTEIILYNEPSQTFIVKNKYSVGYQDIQPIVPAGKKVETLIIDDGVYELNATHLSDDELKNIYIGNNIESINDFAFYAGKMNKIYWGNNVNTVGELGISLPTTKSLSLYNIDIEKICSTNFSSPLSNPLAYALNTYGIYGQKIIGAISGLPSVIGDYSFYNFEDVKSIDLSDVITIGFQAFLHSGLNTVNIPNNVTTIGAYAFSSCDSMTIAQINIERTSSGMFYGCGNLTNAVFNGKYIGSACFKDCSKLAQVYLSNNLTEIESNAFEGCSQLNSISFPTSLTRIGTSAFRNCTGLTELSLPNSLQNLANSAFVGCSNLNKITFLNSFCVIGDRADTIPENATIYGYAGSTAESYATKYNRTFVEIQ